jgi:dihydrofolate reductase
MRRVILSLALSLDGYIARPDGSVDFLDDPKGYSMAPFFKTIDTAIMGRKTYEVGLRLSGGKFNTYGLATYIMTSTLPPGERDGIIFTNKSPKSLIASLRKRRGKHIWHMGGGALARAFLREDLIDEVHLGVFLKLLGEGIPVFPSGFPERHFHLLENKSYGKNFLSLKFARTRFKSAPKPKSKH